MVLRATHHIKRPNAAIVTNQNSKRMLRILTVVKEIVDIVIEIIDDDEKSAVKR